MATWQPGGLNGYEITGSPRLGACRTEPTIFFLFSVSTDFWQPIVMSHRILQGASVAVAILGFLPQAQATIPDADGVYWGMPDEIDLNDSGD